MAWPGYSISAADFKLPGAPNGPYDADVAVETFSHIANIVPAFNKSNFENSGYEVDDVYEILLLSAIPTGATQATLTDNPLYQLFSNAQYEFMQARRGSKTDPNLFYYPCNATPSNWYDESAAAFWPTLEIKSNEMTPVAGGNSAFVKMGGVAQAQKGIWKLRPKPVNAVSLRNEMVQSLTTKAVTLNRMRSPVISQGTVRVKPLNTSIAAASFATVGNTPKPLNANFTRTPVFMENLRSTQAETIFNVKNVPVNTLTSHDLKAQIQKINLVSRDFDPGAGVKATLARKFILKDLIQHLLPDKPVSAVTDGFSVSFQFCRVNIDRPWLKLALLNNKNWYMYNTVSGEYSTGRADENSGIFPLLPISFIVIRNLKITANWSNDDKTMFNNSISFGPFDLSEGKMQQNTLEVKGMQVIAWVSKLTPVLPPSQPV
jgi:hypothetical protein